MTTDLRGIRVGELARASGLSIRTVRYYDQINLLSPSRRTEGGHRVYDDEDVRRLYRICLLRQTGLPLADIAHALDEPGWDLYRAMLHHRDLLDHHIGVDSQLRRRLSQMLTAIAVDKPLSTTELLQTLEDMSMPDDPVQRRISILVYEDIAVIHDYLVRVFGLGAGRLDRDGNGNCVHGEVQAGDGTIWLHRVSPQFGLASPKTLGRNHRHHGGDGSRRRRSPPACGC